MKGIILAGGKGTRLYPMTLPVPKPLLPVYDKPLLYYSLSVLIKAGIRDVLIITPRGFEQAFSKLLHDGSQLGMNISYKEQLVQRGIADAFIVGKEFIGDGDICLLLGDNIFYSPGIGKLLAEAQENLDGGVVFGYRVDDPRPFGVVEFDSTGKVISIEEKPKDPKSNYIIPGLYFYDNTVIQKAESLQPSARGELEITDINLRYLNEGRLNVIPFRRGTLWMDAGTEDSLLDSSVMVKILQQGGKFFCCPEEEAFRQGWIDRGQLKALAEETGRSRYGQYLAAVADEEE
ncbi:MAG: glucose-1-phosphate thymidylyltransferase RfbA [Anaerovoracaceae bacterium]|nr:glucose-1-phosphate thymidylyltransferase RfbA [Anaerovoracaceae bacterium]